MTLVEKRMGDGSTHPVLSVAMPTIEHSGTILLQFNGIPTPWGKLKKTLSRVRFQQLPLNIFQRRQKSTPLRGQKLCKQRALSQLIN